MYFYIFPLFKIYRDGLLLEHNCIVDLMFILFIINMIEHLSLPILIDSKLARKKFKKSEKKVKKIRSYFTNLFQY